MKFDVIGMTNATEAKLAREAEICYATIAMITDYDCWHPEHESVTGVADHRHAQSERYQRSERRSRSRENHAFRTQCKCGSALAHSLITDFKLVPEKNKRKILPPSSASICPRRNLCPCSLLVRLHTMLSKVPYGKVERTLGGAATYFSVSASFFTHVNLVGVVGDDFDPKTKPS